MTWIATQMDRLRHISKRAKVHLTTISVAQYIKYGTLVCAMAALLVVAVPSGPDNPAQTAKLNTQTPTTAKKRPPSNDERLATTLDQIEQTLHRTERKYKNKRSTREEKQALKQLQTQLEQLHQQAEQNFKKIGNNIKTKKLPAVIQQRHDTAVAQYRKNMQDLRTNLSNLNNATNDRDFRIKLKKVKDELVTARKNEKRKPVDVKRNPMRALTPKPNNKPRTTKEAFQSASLFDQPYAKLAAVGDYDISQLPGADDPAFLSETIEVKLTAKIKSKAAELNHDPIKIFNWVHDHTEWLPTFGAIQNADQVLQSQKGNAFDIASLLVALYRASGIPARYAHGVIDLPADRFMNWVGGFTTPEGAHDLAANAGLPISSLTAGGKIVGFRLEHIWVQAAIDFEPSRGAVNKAADSWVNLDPSFKQYDAEPAYDMHALLNFNGNAHFMAYLTDPENLTPYQFYSKKVMGYLNTNKSDWTLKGLYGHERIRSTRTVTDGNRRLFAASLPYKLLVTGYKTHEIPDSLRHKIVVDIANNPSLGIDASYSISFPELGYDRLTLSYAPESAADDAVVEDYGSLYSSPPYLVRIKPQIRKAGTVVATGVGLGLGEKQTLSIRFQSPNLRGSPAVNEITAGVYTAMVFQGMDAVGDAPAIGGEQLQINAEKNEQGLAILDDTFGQFLHNIGKLWFHDIHYERSFYATTNQLVYHQLPSQATVTGALTISYFFGIPKSASRSGYVIDADTDVMAMGAVDNKVSRKRDFMLLAGLTGSAWEGYEISGFLLKADISAVSVMKRAAIAGIPIHNVSQLNISTILPKLSLAPEDIDDIKNGVAAGYTATVQQSEITIGSWKGAGLIILNNQGSGPYLISGGYAGGSSACSDGLPGDVQFPSTLCSEPEWERIVATKPRVIKAVRSSVLSWARKLVGTPYGWGCSDPWSEPNTYCEAHNDEEDIYGIDCSGLVAWAYMRVGYGKFWAQSANTQFQMVDYYPTTASVETGDLMFWCCTQRNKPGAPFATHVGIYIMNDTWIAAQGSKGVQEYSYSNAPSYKNKFIGYGSLFQY